MTLFAPRWVRIGFSAGVVLGLLQLTTLVYVLVTAGAGSSSWMEGLIGAYLCLYCGWFSYLTVIVPVVRITSQTIAWRVVTAPSFREVNLADIVGLRIQDSFDL